MSVLDMFKKPAAPAPTTSATTPAAAANGTVPDASNSVVQIDPATGKPVEASPMDNYKDLWQTDPNAKTDTPFTFNSDPTKLLETAKTVDFKKVITPEVMAKISGGGADAQQALMEAMNNMSQLSFAQSSHAAAKITESALQQQEARFKEMLPGLIKQFNSADNLRSTNPLMNDPAMAPMVEALQTQFSRKYPQATSDQITAHVNDYLNGAADKITGLRPQPVEKNKRQTTNWDNFLADGGQS